MDGVEYLALWVCLFAFITIAIIAALDYDLRLHGKR